MPSLSHANLLRLVIWTASGLHTIMSLGRPTPAVSFEMTSCPSRAMWAGPRVPMTSFLRVTPIELKLTHLSLPPQRKEPLDDRSESVPQQMHPIRPR